MSINKEHEKNCAECDKSITFEDFCRNNPFMSKERAQDFWNDSLISIFCPECYFNLLEKPFKKKTAYFTYHMRFRR